MSASSSGRGGGGKGVKLAQAVPFGSIVDLFEKIETGGRTGGGKEKYLSKYLDYARGFFLKIHGCMDSEKAHGDSLFCIFRLFLPGVDRARKAYGFQAPVLGRLFAEILGLDKESPDGKRLINFKTGSAGQGDFSTTFKSVLESRFSSNVRPSGDGPTLADLHDLLDKLAKTQGVNQAKQKTILQGFISKITPLQGKWLSRILLKGMSLGLNSAVIFRQIHPQARDVFERIGDLEKVCQRLNDQSRKVDAADEITLFDYCCSMLSTRMTLIDDSFDPVSEEGNRAGGGKTMKKDTVTLPTPPYAIEIKWDGERFQIHYDQGTFKYISRQRNVFTEKFRETLTPYFAAQLEPEIQSFILDGEMMAWNKQLKSFTQKGNEIEVKELTPSHLTHRPVFVAFDLLYLNGQVLVNQPLRQRYELLKTVFRPKEGYVMISEQKIGTSKEQVIEALNEAIDNLEEGLIVKDINSVYEPGKRCPTWLKIKPEYLDDNSVEDLDMLILGAYYTDSNRKSGEISHFLVGTVDKSGVEEVFHPVTRVGSGRLKLPEMAGLIKELQPFLVRSEFPGVIMKPRKKPDFYIDPRKSIVLQIKASEITQTNTLRFPRVTKIRRDKYYNDVMTVQEFSKLKESSGGKLAKRTDGRSFGGIRKRAKIRSKVEHSDEEASPPPSFKKPLFVPSDGSSEDDQDKDKRTEDFRSGIASSSVQYSPSKPQPSGPSPRKMSNVKVEKDVFKSQVYCVYGSPAWKTKIEQDIRVHGGEIVQNPVKERFWIVGQTPDNLKVRNAIKSGKYDILKPSWILHCIEKNTMLPFVPNDFFKYTETVGEAFKEKFDAYGDSYTEPLSLDQAKELVNNVMRDDDEDMDFEDSSTEVLKKELFPGDQIKLLSKYEFLKSCAISFRENVDPVLRAQLEFYGGKVVEDESKDSPSHVIVNDPLSRKTRDLDSAYFVKPEWLIDSISKRQALAEHPYLV